MTAIASYPQKGRRVLVADSAVSAVCDHEQSLLHPFGHVRISSSEPAASMPVDYRSKLCVFGPYAIAAVGELSPAKDALYAISLMHGAQVLREKDVLRELRRASCEVHGGNTGFLLHVLREDKKCVTVQAIGRMPAASHGEGVDTSFAYGTGSDLLLDIALQRPGGKIVNCIKLPPNGEALDAYACAGAMMAVERTTPGALAEDGVGGFVEGIVAGSDELGSLSYRRAEHGLYILWTLRRILPAKKKGSTILVFPRTPSAATAIRYFENTAVVRTWDQRRFCASRLDPFYLTPADIDKKKLSHDLSQVDWTPKILVHLVVSEDENQWMIQTRENTGAAVGDPYCKSPAVTACAEQGGRDTITFPPELAFEVAKTAEQRFAQFVVQVE